jgi:transcriptional regulator with XRE-family HTH domain
MRLGSKPPSRTVRNSLSPPRMDGPGGYSPSPESAREYTRYCRNRYIDWTWRRASQLAKQNTLPTDLDDQWIQRTWLYLLAKGGKRLPGTPKLSPSWFTAVAAALEIHRGERLAADCLEARLLSGQSYSQIAARSGVTERAVEAYENLFFAFRLFRQATCWIIANAVKLPAPGTGIELGTALKKFGYLGGEQILEPMIEVCLRIAGRSLVDDLPDGLTASGLRELCIRRALALERVPDSQQAAVALAQLQGEQISSPPLSEPFSPGTLSLDEILTNLSCARP